MKINFNIHNAFLQEADALFHLLFSEFDLIVERLPSRILQCGDVTGMCDLRSKVR